MKLRKVWLTTACVLLAGVAFAAAARGQETRRDGGEAAGHAISLSSSEGGLEHLDEHAVVDVVHLQLELWVVEHVREEWPSWVFPDGLRLAFERRAESRTLRNRIGSPSLCCHSSVPFSILRFSSGSLGCGGVPPFRDMGIRSRGSSMLHSSGTNWPAKSLGHTKLRIKVNLIIIFFITSLFLVVFEL